MLEYVEVAQWVARSVAPVLSFAAQAGGAQAADFDLINQAVQVFENALGLGQANISSRFSVPVTKFLLVLEICFFGLFFAMKGGGLDETVKKIIYVAALVAAVSNMPPITREVVNWATAAGNLAASSPASGSIAPDPSRFSIESPGYIIYWGATQLAPWGEATLSDTEQTWVNRNIIGPLSRLIIWLVALGLFFFLGLYACLLRVEFAFLTLGALVFVPLSVFKPLKFLLSGVIGAFIQLGSKIFTFTVVVSVLPQILVSLFQTPSVGLVPQLTVVGVLSLSVLVVLKTSELLTSMASGQTALGIDDSKGASKIAGAGVSAAGAANTGIQQRAQGRGYSQIAQSAAGMGSRSVASKLGRGAIAAGVPLAGMGVAAAGSLSATAGKKAGSVVASTATVRKIRNAAARAFNLKNRASAKQDKRDLLGSRSGK